MSAANAIPSVSPTLRHAVDTDVDTQSQVTRSEKNWQDEWQRVIDYPLIEWGRNPGQLEDDDTPMPSRTTVWAAIQVAMMLRDQPDPVPAPTRIVPDAHGGIVFERDAGRVFESIRISSDNNVEHYLFMDSRMVTREVWPLENPDTE